MTVKQLIERLQDMPDDHMVVIRGFEGGVDEVNEIEETRVALDVNEEWSYGSHELLDPRDEGDGDRIAQAVYLRNGVGDL